MMGGFGVRGVLNVQKDQQLYPKVLQHSLIWAIFVLSIFLISFAISTLISTQWEAYLLD